MALAMTVTDAELKTAISYKCSNCYAAMAMGNRIVGGRDNVLALCLSTTLASMLEEATERGIDVASLHCAVGEQPVKDSLYYKRATGEMTEREFLDAFRRWQNGEDQ